VREGIYAENVKSLRWLVPVAVLAVAALLRFWALDRPGTLVFDELYYVRDAISQLAHGYPTVWPDDDPSMSGSRSLAFTDAASNAVHPPLGKWLIGLGVLVFGPDSGWGWRSAVAAVGVATVGVTMRLGFLLSRSHLVAWFAGLLLAIDGVHVTLSRVALLDGFLTFFVVLGALLVWRDLRSRATNPSAWRRPWLLAAGLAFGAATAVKWSGLYPLAAFLVFVTVADVIARVREGSPRPVLRGALRAGATALLALPAAAVAYLASWTGWVVAAGGWERAAGEAWPLSLARYHARMLEWHGTLTAPHPYQSHPLEWPLALRPTAMYEAVWGRADGCGWESCLSGITALPNPIVTWAGVIALGVLLWWLVRDLRRGFPLGTPHLAAAFVVTGYLSGWLPWVLTFSRSAVFQFYAVVLTPFAALALALVLGAIWQGSAGAESRRGGEGGEDAVSRQGHAGLADHTGHAGRAARIDPAELRGRRVAVACFLATATLLAVLFFPTWSGVPVAEWFWRAHLWLPGWS